MDRVKRVQAPPDAGRIASFDHMFEWSGSDLAEVNLPEVVKPVLRPARARVMNLSRPRSRDFLVGDRFRVVVTGEPGAVVANTASQEGKPATRTEYGATGPNGRFTMTGRIEAAHAGSWRQVWSVGDAAAEPIEFTVKPAAKRR